MSETTAETVAEAAVLSVKCYCCGLIEQCTTPYINRVRERDKGSWICDLCAEMVEAVFTRTTVLGFDGDSSGWSEQQHQQEEQEHRSPFAKNDHLE